MGLQTFLARKENIYLVLALACGLVMALLNPPFLGVPDEHAHYWRAWAVARGDVRCWPENKIPQSAYDLPGVVPPIVKVPGVGRRVVFNQMVDKLFAEDSTELTLGGASVCGSSPLGYLPQVLGLRLGSLLHLSALADFYLARVFNLIASALLVALAIRIAPFGKIIFLLIGLLPMTLQQFASLSYDGLNIALCFLFIAYVLKLAAHQSGELLGTRELAGLFALGLLAFNAKLGYVGLSLLVFLIPAARFTTPLRYWLYSAGYVAVQGVVFRAVSRFMASGNSGSAGMAGVNSAQQTALVMGSPLHFLSLVYSTIYTDIRFFFETTLFKPGWLNDSLPPLWYAFLVVGMVMLVRNEEEEVPLSRRQRYIILGVFLVNFIALFYAMYAGWTKVGATRIAGVQGRYLLAFLPLLLLFFYKAGFSFKSGGFKKHYSILLPLFYLVLFGWMLSSLFEMFYDKEPDVSYRERVLGRLSGRR